VQTVNINEARRFSLRDVQRNDLVKTATLHVELLCFEAGQRDEEAAHAADRVYQVLEGEALVRDGSATTKRLGKGMLLAVPAGVPHTLENAGGGLLVVMATGAPAPG
jgi:mannose-6-phosphate isomerase-like protein (cupin superfamily)